jgi:glycerophosphoryl diester phosphodiesterase
LQSFIEIWCFFLIDISQQIPLIFGHRGASGYKVENTISAFDLAIQQGVDGLESDIKTTCDGIPFLFHDSHAKLRKNSEDVKVSKLKYEELKNIVLPDNEKVPSLREFLERYAGKKNAAGDLLKFSFDFNLHSGLAASKLFKEFGCESQVEMCASATYPYYLVRKISKITKLIASNSIRRLTFKTFRKCFSKYTRFNVKVFNISAGDFNPEYIPLLTNANYNFYIWDLHDEERLKKFLPFRPQAVYSNYPDLAVKIRDDLFNIFNT